MTSEIAYLDAVNTALHFIGITVYDVERGRADGRREGRLRLTSEYIQAGGQAHFLVWAEDRGWSYLRSGGRHDDLPVDLMAIPDVVARAVAAHIDYAPPSSAPRSSWEPPAGYETRPECPSRQLDECLAAYATYSAALYRSDSPIPDAERPVFELAVRQVTPAIHVDIPPDLLVWRAADTANDMVKAVSADEPDLDAICDRCGELIVEGVGWLWVDDSAAQQRYDADRGRPGRSAGDTGPGSADVPWSVVHADWAKEPATGPRRPYAVDIQNIWTWPGLIAFTGKVMQERWLPYTTWRTVLRDAALGRGKLRARHVQGLAAALSFGD